MVVEAAQRSATRVGLITAPIGLLLVTAPARIGRLLGAGNYDAALRVIGGLDLALVPGLVVGRRRGRWLIARAGLNLVIAGHCVYLVRGSGGRGAAIGASAMVAATVADARAITVLTRSSAT